MNHDEFVRKADKWDSNPERLRVADEFAAEVEKLVEMNPQSEILDFGCGTGLVGLRFAKRVKTLYMLDTSTAMLGILEEKLADRDFGNVQVISDSLQEAGLPEEKIDAVFTSMAMHHVKDVPEVLVAINAVLKKGGQLIIGELLPEDGSFHGENPVAAKGFKPEEFAALLEKAGFIVVQHYNHGLMSKPDKDAVLRQYEKFVLEARKG